MGQAVNFRLAAHSTEHVGIVAEKSSNLSLENAQLNNLRVSGLQTLDQLLDPPASSWPFCCPTMPEYAYLGAPNMVKWGVPEKILQNVD